MSEDLTLNLEFSHSSQDSFHIRTVEELSQAVAYGLGRDAKPSVLMSSFELSHAISPMVGDGNYFDLQDLNSVLPASAEHVLFQTENSVVNEHISITVGDDITGVAEGELALLSPSSAIDSAQRVNGRLDYSDYFNPTRLYAYKDDYLLTVSTDTEVKINLDSFDFDAYLQLVDPYTGYVLAFDDDGGIGTNAQLSFTAQAGGQYLVRATSYWSFEVGAYSLTAYLGSHNEPQPPTLPREFSQASGYGLVNAAAAVALAIGQSEFGTVPNIDGNQWNNDMINAPEVWAQGYTGQGITVAVIDSGVDITHEDLRDNIWINEGEIWGDGIDNDGNGYVDDYFGWNFGVGQNNNNVLPGTNDPGQSHGTHVAGTIAAMNNDIGMTGVAHGANIMTLRMGDVVTDPSGVGRFANGGSLAQAIRYAVDNGARVINMSLGWSDEGGSVLDALAYAAANNVITVSAAGNRGRLGGLASDSPPGRYATDYGVVVGAVDSRQNLADFSNRAGSDSRMQYVTAPGVDIYSTVSDSRRYGLSNGTSMAAPHVAGVVALMLSANPNLAHTDVRSILTGTTVLRSGQSILNESDLEAATDTLPVYPVDLIGPTDFAEGYISSAFQFPKWGELASIGGLHSEEFSAGRETQDQPWQWEISQGSDNPWVARLDYARETQNALWLEALVSPWRGPLVDEELVLAIA